MSEKFALVNSISKFFQTTTADFSLFIPKPGTLRRGMVTRGLISRVIVRVGVMSRRPVRRGLVSRSYSVLSRGLVTE